MLELVRGYAAAVLDEAEAEANLSAVVSDLAALSQALTSSSALRNALADGSIPTEQRGAVASDLLEPRVNAKVVSLATFAIVYERATEIPKTYEQLFELAEVRSDTVTAGADLQPEPPIGRAGALERIRGFAERTFEQIIDQSDIDEVEDELFRLARIFEGQPELRAALSAPDTPLVGRISIISELLSGKVSRPTVALVEYVLRAGRARDVVGAVDYLVELAAAERGRRVGEVRAAVELQDDERSRLAEALSRRTRRPVELRVIIDPSVIGGIDVSVGDTVIDGTVRHRLEQLRDSLFQAS